LIVEVVWQKGTALRARFFYGWRIILAYGPRDVFQQPSKKKPANAGFFAFNNGYVKNQA
jgi:hypothetical protein